MTNPIQRLQDLNEQHMRSMGISGVPLGEVVRPTEAPEHPHPRRCTSVGPQGRCVLPAARPHEMHVRGKDRWEDPEVENLPVVDRVADEIESGLISLGWMEVLGEKFPELMGDIFSMLEISFNGIDDDI